MNLVRPNDPVTGRRVRNDLSPKSNAHLRARHTDLDVPGTPPERLSAAPPSVRVLAPRLNHILLASVIIDIDVSARANDVVLDSDEDNAGGSAREIHILVARAC